MSQLNFSKNNCKISTNSKVELKKNGRNMPPIIREAFENYMGCFYEPQTNYKNEKGYEKAKNDIISEYFKDFEEWMKEKDFKKKPQVKAGCVKFYGLHGIVACYADLQKEKEESDMLENENNRLLDRLAEKNGGNKNLEKEIIDLKEDNEVLQRKINKLKKQLLTTEQKLTRAMESKKIIKQDVSGKHSVVNQERYDEIMSITGNPAEDTSSCESNISMKTTELNEVEEEEEPSEEVKEAVNHIKNIAENDKKVVKKTTGTKKKTTKKSEKDKKPSEKPKKNTSKSENTTKKNEKTEKKTKEKVVKKTNPKKFSEDKKICMATIQNKTYQSQVDLHITEDFAFYQDGNDKYHFVGKVELQKPPEYLQQFDMFTDDRGYFQNVYNDEIVDFHINITALGEKKLNDLLKEDGEQTFTEFKEDKIYKNIEWLSHEEQVKHKFKAFHMYPDKDCYSMNLTTNNNIYLEKKNIKDFW